MKKELGQFYTKNSEYITQDLISIFPKDALVVDPFAGEWDLLNLTSNKKEAFDIDPKNEFTIKQDTLLNPPLYKKKWVFTNPPYLAKNKNSDKKIYSLYKTDDLYKAALLSILECEGGIIIIPLNFFSSEDKVLRKKFLSVFSIDRVNVFEEQVFDDTTYTVCAFSFKRKTEDMPITFVFYPNKKIVKLFLNDKNNYNFEEDFIEKLPLSRINVYRYTYGYSNSYVFLTGIDKRKEKINFSLKEPYKGKKTDRVYATFCFNYSFNEEEQKQIVQKANDILNSYREKYNNLFLTNYRDFGRKRLSFRLAEIFLKNAIFELFGE